MPAAISEETERAFDAETGRAATGTRDGGPFWLVPVLLLVTAFLIFWGFFRPGPTWADLVIVGGIALALIGAIIALNPRRGSPSGGTRRR